MGEVERLNTLAEQINAEHRAFVGTLRKTVEHGIRAGELLAEAKAQCPHGTWLPWLEQNFEGAPRTAQEYMRLYSRRDEILANTRDSAHLSISGALRELAAPREESVEAVPEMTAPEFLARKVSPYREHGGGSVALPEDSLAALDAEIHADRVGEMKERTRRREAREHEESRKHLHRRFMEADAALSNARKAAKRALDEVRDVDFDAETREILESSVEAVHDTLGLVSAALDGNPGADFDAGLAALEYKAQWGSLWQDNPEDDTIPPPPWLG